MFKRSVNAVRSQNRMTLSPFLLMNGIENCTRLWLALLFTTHAQGCVAAITTCTLLNSEKPMAVLVILLLSTLIFRKVQSIMGPRELINHEMSS